MFKAILILGGFFLASYGGYKFVGGAASIKQANDNLIYKFVIDKWTIVKGKLGLKVTATVINPDLNETFKFLYPQLLLLDSSGYPFEASVMYDESLKDKEYALEPRGQITFDPFLISVSIFSMLQILAKVVAANAKDYMALSLQVAKAIVSSDTSAIDQTQLNTLLSAQTAEINKNFKGRLITRVNGINVSYDFNLV